MQTVPQPPSIEAVMASAEWLAHRYDPGHDAIHMVPLPRARHADLPFLTDEYLGADLRSLVLRREDAIAQAPALASVHFLFHSAYCCSTLLAAAFDIPGVAMGLKEPVILNDIVGWRHRGAKGPEAARVLDQALRLLARPFGPGEAVVIKPSNVVNPLIPAMMAMRPDARALLLHAPLEDYLASIARKGMWGRLWVRDLLQKLLREGMVDLGIAPADYLGLTDLQVAAVGWLAQQAQFHRIAEQLGSGRIATLDSERLIVDPAGSLAGLARLFGLRLDGTAVETIASGPIFTRDAKTGQGFARGQRAEEARRGKALYAEELEKVSAWSAVLAGNAGIPMALPHPLTT